MCERGWLNQSERLVNAEGDQLSPEERELHAPEDSVLNLILERGEVVLLHNWTLHRSMVNTTTAPRRGFSVCCAYRLHQLPCAWL